MKGKEEWTLKRLTGPVRNYLLKDFPEDGDIFSAVGDRADHPEADSERDTRSGGAGSESQTGETHTLITCASIPWTHKPVERGRIFLERIFILLRVAM
ncbi:hypothetical protein TNIN_95191 [Trichonephila inaurata madagascariensis]|uniref:Uncharacterized protein n=1 Tax=Trichonephila inaurata madagascariensis TaxID=2747483 RepID=A0A8X6JBM3_9ARAC|nr:hypothetical protein TNIN_95191 [Trichonephila inaurata madagascariensis]